jgi:phage replication O-like protein O
MPDEFYFEGFSSPAFTQLPNAVVDVLLPHLTDPELRVLLYIVRRTFGFQRDSDNISLRQMTDGLKRSAVAKALQGLQQKGIITSQRNSDPERGSLPSTYSLRFSQESTVMNMVESTGTETPRPQ